MGADSFVAFHVKHSGADALARELAALRSCGLTDAVLFALERAVAAEKAKASLPDIALAFQNELAAMKASG